MNAAELPWWLEEGYETCSFCLQHYSYEMEYRCRECDAPVCPMCTAHAQEETVTCPDCHCGEAS